MKLIQSISTRTWASGFRTVVCGSGGCSQRLSERQLANRRVGVMMGEQWYCSYRCFVSAAEKQFAQLLAQGSTSSNHLPRMPIALQVLRRGWLSNEQFKTATEEQRKTCDEMGEVLVRLGYVSEQQITAVRAAQWGRPIFSVPAPTLTAGVYVPLALIHAFAMVPVHYVAASSQLLVGFVQAIEYGVLCSLEEVNGCTAQPCFISVSDYHAQVQAQAKQSIAEELKFDDVHSSTDMARIVCSYGVLINANRVVIVRCKEYVWVRLKSAVKAVDILFKPGGTRQSDLLDTP
ncbi:MAG: hypothetical protein P4L10_08260 [Acidobacteriaceae bacterium]|nr:hypothetical protein [Acidobacteriaceae bacterium]